MLITWRRDATNWFLRAEIYTLAPQGRGGVKWYQSVRRLLDVRMSVSWFDQSVKNNLIDTWKFHVKNPSLNIDTFFDEKRKVAKNLHKHNAFCVAERLFNQGGRQKIYHISIYQKVNDSYPSLGKFLLDAFPCKEGVSLLVLFAPFCHLHSTRLWLAWGMWVDEGWDGCSWCSWLLTTISHHCAHTSYWPISQLEDSLIPSVRIQRQIGLC